MFAKFVECSTPVGKIPLVLCAPKKHDIYVIDPTFRHCPKHCCYIFDAEILYLLKIFTMGFYAAERAAYKIYL